MSKNKKTILIILSILIVLGLFLGVYYAYYIKSINQEESNIVKTKCLNFSLTNEKNDINLDEQYPIPDTECRKLTPYQFTITNTCEQFISYNVNLESLEATTMDSSAVKVMINNEAPVNLSTLESTSVPIDTSKDSKILATGSLGSSDSVDYALRLWMDYGDTVDTSSMNKVFESKVVVTATVGTYKPSDYVTTLHDAILVNEYGVTDVNNAISRIEAKGTPDLSKPAPISENDISDKGLYKSEDDYGKTYYYRGKVSNNNVYFAGFYWQIVKINGDNSMRLIYNGKEKNAEGISKSIESNEYSFNPSNSLLAGAGYLYGQVDGTTFEEIHSNTNNSVIKANVDKWFGNNLKKYEEYLSNTTGFCGDRTVYKGDGISKDIYTYYGAFGRYINDNATLKCPNVERDLYTIKNAEFGNKSLVYPIALITYDELVYAGMNRKNFGKLSYVYSSKFYWTMTQSYYNVDVKCNYIWNLYPDGKLDDKFSYFTDSSIRPVINLKANVEITGGIGTINDPYIVKTT